MTPISIPAPANTGHTGSGSLTGDGTSVDIHPFTLFIDDSIDRQRRIGLCVLSAAEQNDAVYYLGSRGVQIELYNVNKLCENRTVSLLGLPSVLSYDRCVKTE